MWGTGGGKRAGRGARVLRLSRARALALARGGSKKRLGEEEWAFFFFDRSIDRSNQISLFPAFSFFPPPPFHTHTPNHTTMEQTYIMIKPDGVQRGLVGEIIARFEKKGFHLRGLKMKNVPRELAEEHYADLSSKPFFGGLVEYICR